MQTDTTTSLERYPFDVPRPRRRSALKQWAAGLAFAALAAFLVVRGVRSGDYTVMVVGGSFFGALSLVSFGMVPVTRQRARFRRIRRASLGETGPATVDERFCLASTTRLRVAVVVAFGWFSLGMFVTAGFGLAQVFAIMPHINPHVTVGKLILATIIALAFAVVSGSLLRSMVLQQRRSGSLRRAAAGVALGERSVSFRLPDCRDDVSWEHVLQIEATTSATERAIDDAFISVQVAAGDGRPQRTVRVAMATLTVPPDVLYTALRWYLGHPEARAELSGRSTERLDAWRREALSRPR